MKFEPWMLALMDDAGYNGIRDEHIDRVENSLRKMGVLSIDRNTFERACRISGIEPGNFTQADLDELQSRLKNNLS